MTLEIPFNKEIFNHQNQLNFNSVWKKNLKNNQRRILWGILGLLLGGLMIFNENYVGFLFLGIGIHYFVNFYDYWSYYSKSKKRYFGQMSTEIEGYENSGRNCIWEFKDDHFGYTDHKFETKIKWLTFKSFRIIEDTLFLDFDSKNGLSYMLGKSEVKESEWNQIIDIVNEKIKPVHNNA